MQCGKANLFWICFDQDMHFAEFLFKLDVNLLIGFSWINLKCVASSDAFFFVLWGQKFWAKSFILGLFPCGCLTLLSSLRWNRLVS